MNALTHRVSSTLLNPLFVIILMTWMGCRPDQAGNEPGTSSGSHEHVAHHHEPPHGGTVIELGQEAYHLELVLESERGPLICYVMDGHLEQFIRLSQTSIVCDVELADGTQTNLVFMATANRATGEQVGDTAEFHADIQPWVPINRFEGKIREVHIQDQSFTDVAFKYPEGNE